MTESEQQQGQQAQAWPGDEVPAAPEGPQDPEADEGGRVAVEGQPDHEG